MAKVLTNRPFRFGEITATTSSPPISSFDAYALFEPATMLTTGADADALMTPVFAPMVNVGYYGTVVPKTSRPSIDVRKLGMIAVALGVGVWLMRGR